MLEKKAQLGPRAGTPYWGCSDATCPGARPFAVVDAPLAAEG